MNSKTTNRLRKNALDLCYLLLTLLFINTAVADSFVTTQDEFEAAVQAARPGDTITMANGAWRDIEMVFTGNGTADRPITLTAESKGDVIISGLSNLSIAGEYLVVKGLVFRDGYTPTNEVISFRRGKDQVAELPARR